MPDFEVDALTFDPPPRDPRFCSVMTGHFAPWYGFLGFGVLWFFIAGEVPHCAEFFTSRKVEVSPTTPCSVLFEPGCPYVAVYPREGGFVAARWKRD